MIEIHSLKEFLDVGFDFTDLFEQEIFKFLIKRDGVMIYDPVSRQMCDKNKVPVFYVEQLFIAPKN